MEITNKSDNYEIVNDIYKIYKVNNVKECSSGWTPEKWVITLHTENIDTNSNIVNLFILEPHCDAVGHWTYEAGIYIPLYLILKSKIPSLKLAIMTKRKVKTLFFNLFSIPETEIYVYDRIANKYSNLPENNLCIFPSPIAHQHLKEIDPYYVIQLKYFITLFNSIQIPNTIEKDWLLLPRQKNENFNSNDRSVSYTNLYNFFKDSDLSYSILNTDSVTSLENQIKELRSSKYIIVPDGGATVLNFLFCKNKTFYIVDNFSIGQHLNYPVSNILHSTLIEMNKHTLYYTKDENDLLSRFLIK
jgi:hypothetical protein